MSVQTKTWPSGTKRLAQVEKIILPSGKLVMPVHVVVDDQNEGHFLGGGAEDPSAVEGDEGTLTFTGGGLTGGYWKFTKDNK